MKTYPTFAKAKIDYPDFQVFTNGTVFFIAKDDCIEFLTENNMSKCNPADHCSTVEEFLGAGYKFMDGDLYLSPSDELVKLETIDILNEVVSLDKKRFILQSAALNGGSKIPDNTPSIHPEFSVKVVDCNLFNPESNLLVGNPIPQVSRDEFERGMIECCKKIAFIVGRKFCTDVGYEDLPDVVSQWGTQLIHTAREQAAEFMNNEIMNSSDETSIMQGLKSHKKDDPQWNGEGIPPKGAEFFISNIPGVESIIYECCYSSKYVVICRVSENKGTECEDIETILDLGLNNYTFDKPKTPEQVEVEELAAVLNKCMVDLYGYIGEWDELDDRRKSPVLEMASRTIKHIKGE